MGAFSRIRYVIAANVNALIERAENPEKLLRALIREMEDAGEDARLASAELLAEQTHLERVAGQLESEIAEWQERAEKAVETSRDDLARAALKAKAERADTLESVHDESSLLTDRIAHLEQDMTTLKGKLAEAKLKLKEMLARQEVRPAPSRREVKLSGNERKIQQAMGRFDRLQSQVERLEARVRSYEVGTVAPSAWDAEVDSNDPVIEAELEALKMKTFGQQSEAKQLESSES
ncbi:MAG: phage shock protein PspA [Xanthomonadales bacterium]|nr:phage shock protein PspA [Xanthomonadales bacterium]